jgi:hypothetical protein
MKAVAMIGWSGSGEFEDLERTVSGKLSAVGGETDRIGDTLVVADRDPVAVARRLGSLPGVAWVAVGYRFGRPEGYLKTLELLAKRYVSRGKTFKISAQVADSEQTAGDAVLSGNSQLLSSIPGSRVDERKPGVRFRVSIQGPRGSCGAQVREGPGGFPTGEDWVSCLVSGGERSSSMAWMAALSGYSLRLVHSWVDDASLRAVARLYSELSFRMDPRRLELVLLTGGQTFGRIGSWLRDNKEAAFAGTRVGRPDSLADTAKSFPNLAFPLVLLQDTDVGATYRSLGVGRAANAPGRGGMALSALEATARYSEAKFGGAQADASAVIDALKRRGQPRPH